MPTAPKPISSAQHPNRLGLSQSLSRSWHAPPIAQYSLARDIEAASDTEEDDWDSDDDDDQQHTPLAASAPAPSHDYSLGFGSYRRPSVAGARNHATLGPNLYRTSSIGEHLSREERQRALDEERSLLRDNNLIPPKHPRADGDRRKSTIGRIFSRDTTREDALDGPSDTSPLLGDSTQPYGGQDDPTIIKQKWEEAVKEGKIQTTWQREAKVLTSYSLPLMATFLMQYSLTVASIFTVGHLGTAELGAVSLASMTANITGYAIYQGLATSLDTLCAQAYGSGRKKLVGLQMQRMIYFLWTSTLR